MHMGPTLMCEVSPGQDMTQMFQRVQGLSSFLNFCSILSGSDSQMLMGPTLMLAESVGQDHDPNVPKGPEAQLLFEFLLYLIRKWFSDAHGAHPGVGGIGGSRP